MPRLFQPRICALAADDEVGARNGRQSERPVANRNRARFFISVVSREAGWGYTGLLEIIAGNPLHSRERSRCDLSNLENSSENAALERTPAP